MADLDRSLDSAIDALAVGEPVADARSEELHDLVELARLLRALPESQWPDPTFPDRLLAGLDGHRSPARRAWTRPSQWALTRAPQSVHASVWRSAPAREHQLAPPARGCATPT